jgi:GNAT superfamily N-acetyltransferase
MKPTRIRSVSPNDWTEILRASQGEGHNMVNRLLTDFDSGTNRFDSPGEILLVHLDSDSVVGVCGLNLERETCFGKAGRVRRLYVIPGCRNAGLGRCLIEAIISFASAHHDVLTVNVGKLAARGFYEHIGFTPIDRPGLTHKKELER